MKKRRSRFLAMIVLATAGACFAAPAELTNSRLTYYGLGPLKIGMSVPDVKRAGLPIKIDEQFSNVEECGLASIANQENVLLLLENSRIARIEIHSKRFSTFSGAKVGDSEQDIQRIYGARVKTEPHQYDPDGHYMTVASSDGKHALVFETDGKVVTEFRAGLLPAVQYVEHCL